MQDKQIILTDAAGQWRDKKMQACFAEKDAIKQELVDVEKQNAECEKMIVSTKKDIAIVEASAAYSAAL